MNTYGIVIFETSSAALRAESVIKASDLKCKLIPTPRKYSSDCGIALRFDWINKEEVISVMQGANIRFTDTHPMPA